MTKTVEAPVVVETPENELVQLKNWLNTLNLGINPTVHVNPQYNGAMVVVDVGQPIKQVRLNGEQITELSQRLKRTVKEIIGKDASIRVSADNGHGIHWASVS